MGEMFQRNPLCETGSLLDELSRQAAWANKAVVLSFCPEKDDFTVVFERVPLGAPGKPEDAPSAVY